MGHKFLRLYLDLAVARDVPTEVLVDNFSVSRILRDFLIALELCQARRNEQTVLVTELLGLVNRTFNQICGDDSLAAV